MAADRGMEGSLGQGHFRAPTDAIILPPITQVHHTLAGGGQLHHDVSWYARLWFINTAVRRRDCSVSDGCGAKRVQSFLFDACFGENYPATAVLGRKYII